MTRTGPRTVLLAALAAAAGPMPGAWAQQGWAPMVVSSVPEAADRVAGERGWAPLTTPDPVPVATPRPASRPLLGAKPALMQIAVQDRPPPAAPASAPPAASPPPPAQPKRSEAPAPALTTSAARQFCINITDAAADAKFAWQKRALADLQQELDKRIQLLDAKTAELQAWMSRRDEFSAKARQSLVLIYGRMRPDAAAQQLIAMDEETAAAVLAKLDARIASGILNEMEPAQAARLTGIIAGAARTAPKSTEGRKS